MGLFRLWWIPDGCAPDAGTYVRYDSDALLATLMLEAHRAGAAVIGEDLGTVEAGVREHLADLGVLGTSVQRFEYVGGSEGGMDRFRPTSGVRSAWPHSPPTTCRPPPRG